VSEEAGRTRSRRRTGLLVGGGVALLAAVVAIALVLGGEEPTGPLGSRGEPAGSPGPAIPAFRFSPNDRSLVLTDKGKIKRRMRVAGLAAATTTANLLSDLYTEGFLDPANWQGSYADAFRIFAGSARADARQRAEVLTAGASAADRFERIEPVAGALTSRILLDRLGKPVLVVSLVRFRARGVGEETTILRSSGRYFFERVDGLWRIVSFDVERHDERAA
jgi:hypothetical protein